MGKFIAKKNNPIIIFSKSRIMKIIKPQLVEPSKRQVNLRSQKQRKFNSNFKSHLISKNAWDFPIKQFT